MTDNAAQRHLKVYRVGWTDESGEHQGFSVHLNFRDARMAFVRAKAAAKAHSRDGGLATMETVPRPRDDVQWLALLSEWCKHPHNG